MVPVALDPGLAAEQPQLHQPLQAASAVVGLVAVTPAAGFVTPRASMVIVALTAAGSHLAVRALHPTRVDDTLDVFACHASAASAARS